MKINLSEKTGKTYFKNLEKGHDKTLIGKRLGETIKLDSLGLQGYEAIITGGSDNAGFPMRSGLLGAGRKRIFTYVGVGFSGRDRWEKTQKGLRMKVAVAGQKISATTTQVNLKILKEGAQVFEDAKKEEKKE